MEWYETVFLICGIIVGIIILVLVIAYVCYMQAFHHKPKPIKNSDEILLPNDEIYKKHQDLIKEDIINARCMPFKEYTIKSFDNLTLYGKYFENFKNAPIEIMFHGYKGSGERDLSTGIRRAKECGHNCLIVDQRAHGKSEGFVISFGINEHLDCLAWIDFVIKTFGVDVKIMLTGISMGAATVMMAAGKDLPKNVFGVLADCGYDEPKTIIKKYIKDMHLPPNLCYPFVRLGAYIFGKFNLEAASPIKNLQNAKIPVLFIHGNCDSFVPYQMSENLYAVCSSKKKLVIIDNAEHGVSYLVCPFTYINEVKEFFEY